VRVVYRGGAFVPEGDCDVDDGTAGLVAGQPDIAAAVDLNVTRDQMHERH